MKSIVYLVFESADTGSIWRGVTDSDLRRGSNGDYYGTGTLKLEVRSDREPYRAGYPVAAGESTAEEDSAGLSTLAQDRMLLDLRAQMPNLPLPSVMAQRWRALPKVVATSLTAAGVTPPAPVSVNMALYALHDKIPVPHDAEIQRERHEKLTALRALRPAPDAPLAVVRSYRDALAKYDRDRAAARALRRQHHLMRMCLRPDPEIPFGYSLDAIRGAVAAVFDRIDQTYDPERRQTLMLVTNHVLTWAVQSGVPPRDLGALDPRDRGDRVMRQSVTFYLPVFEQLDTLVEEHTRRSTAWRAARMQQQAMIRARRVERRAANPNRNPTRHVPRVEPLPDGPVPAGTVWIDLTAHPHGTDMRVRTAEHEVVLGLGIPPSKIRTLEVVPREGRVFVSVLLAPNASPSMVCSLPYTGLMPAVLVSHVPPTAP